MLGATVASEVYSDVGYRLENKLGEGGTAAAYLATRVCPKGESPVVMKVILPGVVAQAGRTAALVVKKEAVALGRLNERVPPSSFVVRLMDVGTVPCEHALGILELPWLAVEYVHGGVEGTTLDERVRFSVKRTGFAFDPERAARALSHVCEGLRQVHEVGVIHRDLTPNNVLCCGFGDAEVFKISDFGVARPQGLDATFETAVLGTPGYMAPEQGMLAPGQPGFSSDVFSLAGIAYFVLAGEEYFPVREPLRALILAGTDQRRTLAESPTLCPELRDDPDTTKALDEALARASATDPKVRPQSAQAFARTVLPLLSDTAHCRPSQRHVSSILGAEISPALPGWDWRVRHPPGDERAVRSVGWDGDGHCLAVTSHGLACWNGTEWLPVTGRAQPAPEGVRFVERIGPGRWLVGGEGAMLAEHCRTGPGRILHGPDDRLAFTNASGDLADVLVVVGEHPGWPPLLHAVVCGHWLKPLPVQQASGITCVTRLDEARWLVVGRSVDAAAFAAIYVPLAWELHPLPVPESRALVACAGRWERQVAVAVGGQGAVLRVDRDEPTATALDAAPNLACVDIDVLDRTWAGAAGELWASSDHGANWTRIWRDPAWHAPFISILADVGLVVAMTADGAVLECRAAFSRVSVPPEAT